MRAKKGKQQAPPTTLAEAEVVTAPPPPPRKKAENKQTQTKKKDHKPLPLSAARSGFFRPVPAPFYVAALDVQTG